MNHFKTSWTGGLGGVLVTLLALTNLGCSDEEVTSQMPGVGGATAGGHGGAGGSSQAGTNAGGSAGLTNTSRGNPENFPEECSDSCEEACARLEECGAESSTYPIGRQACVALCGQSRGGPVWQDISKNFLCCASQASCGDVQNCGGWLKHPDPVASCNKMCGCLLGGSDEPGAGSVQFTAPKPPEGARAPTGYRFAPASVVVTKQSTENQQANSLSLGPIAELVESPRYFVYEASLPTTKEQLEAQGLSWLPTFVDSAGRIAGGTQNLSVQLLDAGATAKQKLEEIKQIAARYGLSRVEPLKYGHNLYYIEGSNPWQTLEAYHALSERSGVHVEIDMVRQVESTYRPQDPLLAEQWHLENQGKKDSVVGVDGRVTEAWDFTFGNSEVVIAINDDGVATEHVDLAFSMLPPLNYPENWQERLGQGSFGNHGTPVAGVAAAGGDNGYGGAGVCPGCTILPHWFGEFGAGGGVTDKAIADGFIRMVDEGAWVINNSWGAAGGDPRFFVQSFGGGGVIPTLVRNAFDYAETEGRGGKGTVIVFASGNSNQVMNDYGAYPSVVAVAAVDDQGLKSYYSNFGKDINISAPSNGGLNGITTTAAPDGYTAQFGGTSSASPFIAGAAGLILSANPELTAAEVRDILTASASRIDPVWGEWNSGFSNYYGFGLVNTYVAVRMALGHCTDPADCQAPSDDCGANCATGTSCSECRTDLDCGGSTVCQAIPALGKRVCVAPAVDDTCPADADLHGGYCLPHPSACGVCEATERCNGRDDDCDGEIDEDADCSTLRCVQASEGCGEEGTCAGITCTTACNNNTAETGCGEGERCDPVKNRYGKSSPTVRGCNQDLSAGCPAACQMLASSLPDDELTGFIECMDNGKAACSNAFNCASSLPINF